jgi:hypothetical protein
LTESLFIAYSQADMADVDWIRRLRMYLAPWRKGQSMDVWDDSRIGPGRKWVEEIREILGRVKVAVLMVGPAFLSSDFVVESEATDLLANASDMGLKVLPLIIGYCGYEATQLGQFPALNDTAGPLEALKRSEQNRLLNKLCMAVYKALRDCGGPREAGQGDIKLSLREAVRVMKDLLDTSHNAFLDQCRLRDALVRRIEHRLEVHGDVQYEKFFCQYFPYLTESEKYQFQRIRAITEVLHARNEEIVHTMEENPELLDTFPILTDLRQHLVFWLNKFDRVFTRHRAMCVLYTDATDAVPFPSDIHDVIHDWLVQH